jgi:hypothetical protein
MEGKRDVLGSTHHDTGVVDEDINPAPCLDDSLDNSFTTLLISDILGDTNTFSAVRVDNGFDFVGVDLLLWEVDNGDLDESVLVRSA